MEKNEKKKKKKKKKRNKELKDLNIRTCCLARSICYEIRQSHKFQFL